MNLLTFSRFVSKLIVVACTYATTCVGAAELQFVQIASTTNPSVSDFTKSLNAGIELAFDRVNRTGGVKGDRLKLRLIDDEFKTDSAVAIVNEVAGEPGVLGLLGCVGTPALAAVTKSGKLVEASLASIAPFTGASALLKERNVFPVRASYEAELERLLQQAAGLYQQRVAMIWWKAGVGPILAEAAPGLAQKQGMALAANIGFELSPDKAKLEQNISEATLAAKAVKPQAVLIVASGQPSYQVIRSIRANVGSGVPIYSISAVGWKDLIANVGIDAAKGVTISQAVPFPYSGVKTPLVREYLEDIARAKREPDYASLEGYLGGRVVVMALSKVNGTVTRESFLKAISHLGRYESGDFLIDYTPELRTSMKNAEITMISSAGRLVR